MKLKEFAKAFVLISVLFLVSCTQNENKETKKAVRYVKVETLDYQSSHNELIYNGSIKEKSLNTLSFRVGGPLVKLDVQSGDYVRKGQVLGSIDKRDYQTQLQTRKAQFEQVEGEYKRYQELHKKNQIPDNSYEKVESGYLMAKAALDNAIHQLEDTELKAPFSGYIHEKMSENFQTVGPGQPVLSIIDKSALEVQISVPENQISNIDREGLNFINIKNANISRLPVKLINISNKTGKDGLYKVKYGIEGEACQSILPGMSAEVYVQSSQREQSTNISSSAIFNRSNMNYVWLFDSKSKTIQQKQVTIKGFASDGKIEIVEGLTEGDAIVTSGVSLLFNGESVEPILPTSSTNIGGLL